MSVSQNVREYSGSSHSRSSPGSFHYKGLILIAIGVNQVKARTAKRGEKRRRSGGSNLRASLYLAPSRESTAFGRAVAQPGAADHNDTPLAGEQ